MDSIRSICEYNGFDSNFDIVEDFKNPDLPEGGCAENNVVLGVKRSSDYKPCVWIQYYERFLNEATVFLGEFYVDKSEQGSGIGRTVYQHLETD
ncbi:MAG: GNAT family N-acetyltransferase [Treponema sp.]